MPEKIILKVEVREEMAAMVMVEAESRMLSKADVMRQAISEYFARREAQPAVAAEQPKEVQS